MDDRRPHGPQAVGPVGGADGEDVEAGEQQERAVADRVRACS
jgi:hypothetical protein